MGLNERIKYLRVELLHLTQTEFGQEIGVTGAAASRLESGDRGLTNQMAAAICRRWGVSETWLRTGEGEPFPVKPDDVRLAEAAADILSGVAPATRRQFFSLLCSLSDEQLDMASALLDDILERWQEQKESDA